ncbi:MAG: phenylalanine--tRNA ligase subunit beta, partial [Ignavibacteria bacterium]|nr:phenylalanine--tRNA ligase subunit beta [Ignavibacteria bacterium]
EFNVELITKNVNFSRIYNPISKFPSIKRDLAITVDKKVKYEEIKDSVLRSGGRLLKEMELFDIYEGDKIEQSRKSLAFSLEFASSERTLNDEETKVIIDKIIKNLTKNLGAELRK